MLYCSSGEDQVFDLLCTWFGIRFVSWTAETCVFFLSSVFIYTEVKCILTSQKYFHMILMKLKRGDGKFCFLLVLCKKLCLSEDHNNLQFWDRQNLMVNVFRYFFSITYLTFNRNYFIASFDRKYYFFLSFFFFPLPSKYKKELIAVYWMMLLVKSKFSNISLCSVIAESVHTKAFVYLNT